MIIVRRGMETSSPTAVNALVKVQRKLDGAVSVLRKDDEDRKEELAKSVAKVKQLERKVQQNARQMVDYESQIEELKKRDNDIGLNQLRFQLNDKSKMVKSLVKRVKIYDEILTKKQEEFDAFMKKEKEVRKFIPCGNCCYWVVDKVHI